MTTKVRNDFISNTNLIRRKNNCHLILYWTFMVAQEHLTLDQVGMKLDPKRYYFISPKR